MADTITGWRLTVCGILSLVLSGAALGAEQGTPGTKAAVASAKPSPTTKPGKKTASKTSAAPQPQTRETGAAESLATQPETVPTGRYQMLKAGERVVILDTLTGETRIIEPEAPKALQQVDVGRAWVVVTVLGNASSTERQAGSRVQEPRP